MGRGWRLQWQERFSDDLHVSLTLKILYAKKTCILKCRLFYVVCWIFLQNFQTYFLAYRQIVWTLIRLLLDPHCLQKWLLKSQADDKADGNCCDWQIMGYSTQYCIYPKRTGKDSPQQTVWNQIKCQRSLIGSTLCFLRTICYSSGLFATHPATFLTSCLLSWTPTPFSNGGFSKRSEILSLSIIRPFSDDRQKLLRHRC